MSKTAAEWVKEGMDLGRAGKQDEALQAYDSAIATDPKYGEAYFRKAFLFDNMKKDAQTIIDFYLKAIENGYNGWISYYNLGAKYNSLGKREEAIEAYTKSLALHEDADCYENKGNALMALGRIDECIQAFLDSLRVNPKNWTVHPRLGGIYASIEKNEEAMKYYDLCLANNPKDYRSNLRKGELLTKLEKYQEAFECFKLIDNDPQIAVAQLSYYLGECANILGMKEKANEYWSRADRMKPANALDWLEKGRCYYMLGRKTEAMEAFHKSKDLFETDRVTMLLPKYIELIKSTLKSMLEVEEGSKKAEEAITKLEEKKANPVVQKLLTNIKKLQEEKTVAQDKAVEQLGKQQAGPENKELSELERLREEFNKQLAAIQQNMEAYRAEVKDLDTKVKNLKNDMEDMKEELSNKMDDFDKKLTSELEKQDLSDEDQAKLKGYFKAFCGTFSSAFVTAQVIDSDQVQINSDSNVATFLSVCASFAPFVGDALSKGVKSLGDFMKSKEMKTNARKVKRIAPDSTKLSQIVGKSGFEILKDKKKQQQVINMTSKELKQLSGNLFQKIQGFCEQLGEKVDVYLYSELYQTPAERMGHNDANNLIQQWIKGTIEPFDVEDQFVEVILKGDDGVKPEVVAPTDKSQQRSQCCTMF